jgi:hypothetical protein
LGASVAFGKTFAAFEADEILWRNYSLRRGRGETIRRQKVTARALRLQEQLQMQIQLQHQQRRAGVALGTLLSGQEQVVGYYGAFYAYDQSQGDAFGFVVVCFVEKVDGAQAGSEADCRTGGLAANALRYKRTHERIGFTVAIVQAALGGEGIGGDQTGDNSSVDGRFERPETVLARGVRKRRTARHKILGGGGDA